MPAQSTPRPSSPSGPAVYGAEPAQRAGDAPVHQAGLVTPGLSRRLRPAVFLDRDGVINRNRPDYVKSWAEFEFLPGVFRPLRRLAASPYVVLTVSNQSAVGRGLMSLGSLEEIHWRMVESIHQHGGKIDAATYCPHSPVEGCGCRKPQPGQLLVAADHLGLDLARSFFVGDAQTDVLAAIGAGCGPILVLSGRGRSQLGAMPANLLALCHVAEDLSEAVDQILEGPGPGTSLIR